MSTELNIEQTVSKARRNGFICGFFAAILFAGMMAGVLWLQENKSMGQCYSSTGGLC